MEQNFKRENLMEEFAMYENIKNAKLVALYELKEEIFKKIHTEEYMYDSFEEYSSLELLYFDIINIIDDTIEEMRCPF